MNRAETHDLLTFIAIYDNRRTDDAVVLAWHAIISDLSPEDCRAAVMNHFATSDAYLKPVHVRQGVVAIRNERAEKQPHEIRALPSRFEHDEIRDSRIQRGAELLAQRWSVAEESAASNSILEKALDRARRERKGKQATTPPRRHTGGPGIQLEKVTRPPEWADDKAREHASIAALHQAGRHCGRRNCPTCTALAEVIPLQPKETPA